jgi:hypothetical protein
VPSSRGRNSDIKLIVSATVAVLLAGFFIAGALFIATGGSKSTVCAPQNLGHLTDVRQDLVSQGPYFVTAGGGCGAWVALDQDNVVAYKTSQPGCTLTLKRDGWHCGGRVVEASTLSQFPVRIQRVGQTDAVVIDFAPPTTTTS